MSKKILCEFVHINELTTIKFKNIIFKTDKHFNCKCGSELFFKKKENKKLGAYLEIICCSNEKCESKKKLKRSKYWEFFFPDFIYQEQMIKMKKNMLDNHITNIDMWIKNGLSEIESLEKISQLQRENSLKNIKNRFKPTKENYRKLGYSEEEIYNFSLTPAMLDFWIKKGYSETESKNMVKMNQSFAASFVNFDKRLLPSNIDYWINKGFDVDEAIINVKNHQNTFSKEICIKKFGENGIKVLNKRNEKWFKTLKDNGNMLNGYSKISQELFNSLGHDENYFYATKNNEISLKKDNSLLYLYDFVDIKNKKIIEYNGDLFHANPKYFKDDDEYHPFRHELASVKWEKDKKKIQVAKDLGYDVLIIWDSDYRKNKEKIIAECKDFLKIR